MYNNFTFDLILNFISIPWMFFSTFQQNGKLPDQLDSFFVWQPNMFSQNKPGSHPLKVAIWPKCSPACQEQLLHPPICMQPQRRHFCFTISIGGGGKLHQQTKRGNHFFNQLNLGYWTYLGFWGQRRRRVCMVSGFYLIQSVFVCQQKCCNLSERRG